jgi:toxin-antitoxin system PIN domain toxin
VIAVDTNILVYAHRSDSPFHGRAAPAVRDLAESGKPWAIPWACVHEFLSITTHPRIYQPASSLDQALDQLGAWFESPGLILLAELPGYLNTLRSVVESAKIVGPRVHDARIAAICIQHGVRTLWTADRDLSRFSGLGLVNPTVE